MEIHGVENMALAEAQAFGLKYIKTLRVKASKQWRLKQDIIEAPTSTEVSRILWQLELAGQGLGTVGSAWSKHYKQNA